MCFELLVYLDLSFPFMPHSLCTFLLKLHMTRYLRLPTFCFLVVYAVYSVVSFKWWFRSGSKTSSRGPLLKAIHMCFWNKPGFLEMFPTHIQNPAIVQTSCVSRESSVLYVGLPVCICSDFIGPHPGDTKSINDSVSA